VDRTILAGQRWEEVIETALNEARCVIVLWSKDSVQSDWVRAEANEARQRGILVPALLDDVKVPLAFRGIQMANLVYWRGGLPSPEFDELARAISEILGGGVRPAGSENVVPTEVRESPKCLLAGRGGLLQKGWRALAHRGGMGIRGEGRNQPGALWEFGRDRMV
jgi:hypothetical protein